MICNETLVFGRGQLSNYNTFLFTTISLLLLMYFYWLQLLIKYLIRHLAYDFYVVKITDIQEQKIFVGYLMTFFS